MLEGKGEREGDGGESLSSAVRLLHQLPACKCFDLMSCPVASTSLGHPLLLPFATAAFIQAVLSQDRPGQLASLFSRTPIERIRNLHAMNVTGGGYQQSD